ncbi:MAG TPA: hypothetical protein VMU94_00025 [Streptosporangiaceae bacterium]|nr:hypothetical protein [Streptosporangiaceae bacterium]
MIRAALSLRAAAGRQARRRDHHPPPAGVRIGYAVDPDLAWACKFPARQLQPIAGLIASATRRST